MRKIILVLCASIALTFSPGYVFASGQVASGAFKEAVFTLTSSGTIVSAVTGKRIKVFCAVLAVSGAMTAGMSTVSGTEALPLSANGGYVACVQPPAFIRATAAGSALGLVTVGTGTVSGWVSYWDDDAN
jgi:hypothetical protein